MQNNITKKQHYVPQAYLRGFSVDGKRVFAFNNKTNKTYDSPIPIESICRKDYLYEIKNNKNKIITPNYIENVLCNLEGQFAKYRKKLEAKAFLKENFKTSSFLSSDEKAFWYVYTAIQLMRLPTILNAAEQLSNELLEKEITDNEAHMIAIAQCLPFFREIKQGDSNALLAVLPPIEKMTISVGVDTSESLFTSDCPICCYAPNSSDGVFERVEFPVSSSLIMCFLGGAMRDEYKRNRLFPLEEDDVTAIKEAIVYSSISHVFSKRPFSKREIDMIRRVRRDKEEDITTGRIDLSI